MKEKSQNKPHKNINMVLFAGGTMSNFFPYPFLYRVYQYNYFHNLKNTFK